MTLARVPPEDLVLIGRVVRPHGIDGRLKITSYAESAETFLNSKALHVKASSGRIEEVRVLSVRPAKKFFLLSLEGVQSLEAAEQYRGAEVYTSKNSLSRTGGEYFWYELIGLKVYSVAGVFIGEIKQILPTGSNDIFVVGEGKKEILIPATHDVVKQIDLENKRMIILEMEGLLDLNEA